jgi:hypothetical protein
MRAQAGVHHTHHAPACHPRALADQNTYNIRATQRPYTTLLLLCSSELVLCGLKLLLECCRLLLVQQGILLAHIQLYRMLAAAAAEAAS